MTVPPASSFLFDVISRLLPLLLLLPFLLLLLLLQLLLLLIISFIELEMSC
jgi:hypothetical protein